VGILRCAQDDTSFAFSIKILDRHLARTFAREMAIKYLDREGK